MTLPGLALRMIRICGIFLLSVLLTMCARRQQPETDLPTTENEAADAVNFGHDLVAPETSGNTAIQSDSTSVKNRTSAEKSVEMTHSQSLHLTSLRLMPAPADAEPVEGSVDEAASRIYFGFSSQDSLRNRYFFLPEYYGAAGFHLTFRNGGDTSQNYAQALSPVDMAKICLTAETGSRCYELIWLTDLNLNSASLLLTVDGSPVRILPRQNADAAVFFLDGSWRIEQARLDFQPSGFRVFRGEEELTSGGYLPGLDETFDIEIRSDHGPVVKSSVSLNRFAAPKACISTVYHFPGLSRWVYSFAVDSSGGIFYPRYWDQTIHHIDPGSSESRVWRDNVSMRTPTGFDIDGRGNLFMADFSTGIITRFDPDGNSSEALRVRSTGVWEVLGQQEDLLLALYGSGAVSRYSPEMNLLSVNGGFPAALKHLAADETAVMGSGSGFLGILNRAEGRVRLLQNRFLAQPEGLAAADGNFYVSDRANNLIHAYHPLTDSWNVIAGQLQAGQEDGCGSSGFLDGPYALRYSAGDKSLLVLDGKGIRRVSGW